MDNISPQALNSMFMNKLEGGDMTKIGALGAAYVKKILRETSFAYKVQPPQQVTKADLQRSTTHEGFTKIVDIEPDSSAVVLDFRAQPEAQWVTSKRAEVTFWTISSKRFQKNEQELLSWEMPITKVLEINTVKDIQTQIDKAWMELSVQALRTEIAAGRLNKNIKVEMAAAKVKRGIQAKGDLLRLFDLHDGNALPLGGLLMSKVMFNSFAALDNTQVGSILNSEVAVDGFRYNTLMGVKCITSLKSGAIYDNLLYPNEVWLYSEPDFLGRMYVLNSMKFWINKVANMVEWQSWMDLGMAIVGTNAVARQVYCLDNDNCTTTANVTGAVIYTDGSRSAALGYDSSPFRDPRDIAINTSI